MKTASKTPPAKKKKRTRPHAKRSASTGGRFGPTDELWARMEPCLRAHKNTHRFGGGRPRVPDRECAEAIFFVLRTGCQWNALAATGLCPSSTAHDRFQEWVEDGFFLRFWQAGLAEYDAFDGIDWEGMSMDGAVTKAPLAGEKTGPSPVDRAKAGPKRSWLVEGGGVPVGPSVPAEQGDVLELDELWGFVGGKACQLWLWVALCQRTRQIVAWTLGDRSLQSACGLRADLPRGYRRCATRSDFWDAYAAAFPKRTHRRCGKEAGETCHVERWFGTLRQRVSRLVRRTLSFSQHAENHLDAVHCFVASYNLAIKQSTLA